MAILYNELYKYKIGGLSWLATIRKSALVHALAHVTGNAASVSRITVAWEKSPDVSFLNRARRHTTGRLSTYIKTIKRTGKFLATYFCRLFGAKWFTLSNVLFKKK